MDLTDLLKKLRSLNAKLPRNRDEPQGDPILFDDTANADGSRGLERVYGLVTSPIGPWLTDALASGAFDGIAPRCKDSLSPLSHHLRAASGDDSRMRFRLLVDWLRGNGDLQSHGAITGPQLADAISAASAKNDGRMKVPWSDTDTNYISASEAVELPQAKRAGLSSLQTLSKRLTPNGPVHYMRKGQRRKVHLVDFLAYLHSLPMRGPAKTADTQTEGNLAKEADDSQTYLSGYHAGLKKGRTAK